MFMTRADGAPIAFAGLWSVWRGPDKDQEPLALGDHHHHHPNDTMAPIHDRMPVILPRVGAGRPGSTVTTTTSTSLSQLLVPAADDVLVVTPVSTAGQQRPQQRARDSSSRVEDARRSTA